MTRKIAFIATVYRHLEAFHIPFIQQLQDKGFEVHAYAQKDNGKEGIQQQKAICHDIPFQRNPFHLDNVKALKQLTKSLLAEEFDMVHVHTPVAGFLGRVAARKANIPCVIYTAHGFHFFEGAPLSHWILYYPAEKIMARWTDHLIAINQEDYVRAQKFKVKKQVHYVPGVGVETDKYRLTKAKDSLIKKRNELKITEKDFVILCVGELNRNKNQRQLINALQLLIKKTQNIKCLIVGDGDESENLINDVTEKQLEHNVYFLGFRKDIPELIATSDVISLISRREGLPRALLEGLAAGKPILATDVRGNRDLVQNDVNGYLVPINDIHSTANAIQQLMDVNKRIEMGKQSMEMSEQYDLGNVQNQMEKIYNRVFEER